MAVDPSEQDRKPRRVGVFGGTFDPIHIGHVEVARFVLKAADLDVVLMVPAGIPWLRENAPGASPEHRLRMVELAIERIEGVELSRVDVDRSGETYTADTLSDLRQKHGPDDRFILVLGVDAAVSMDQWKRAGELADMCDVLVVGRPGERWNSELHAEHPASDAKFLEGPMIDVSATEIRKRLFAGEGLSGILPERVERYIRDNGLYGVTSATERENRS